MKRDLPGIKKDLKGLSLAELRQVNLWLQKLLREAEGVEKPQKQDGEGMVVEERHGGGKTYRLEYTRCGKAACRCAAGTLHGPYWYSYWMEGGKTKSRYVGKELSE